MTLKEKYTVKNRGGAGRLLFLYSIWTLLFVLYSSQARYETFSEVYAKIEIADWKIELNGEPLKNGENKLEHAITLTPTKDIDAEDHKKIKPGQEGYFDIVINPTGTEVSLEYQIMLDLTNSHLPENLEITSYSVNGGTEKIPVQTGNTVEGRVLLGSRDVLGENDIQTVRYYWTWGSAGAYDVSDYDIAVKVELKQIS